MYSLPYFKENDKTKVIDFIKSHPFAFLAGSDENNYPVATQVPLFLDEMEGKLFLRGHIMRNTDHHRGFIHNNNVLAVFTGAHTYVSASWYENKEQASTWNYMSVHARGVMRFLDEQALLGILRRTTNYFENNPHSGANFEDLPREYVDRMLKAIVAFEIEVTGIENVFKLSQNRDEKSFENIIKELDKRGEEAQYIAAQMKERKSDLFKTGKGIAE